MIHPNTGRTGIKTLTLDLSTTPGFVVFQGDRILDSGTLVLATPEELDKQRKDGGERILDIRFVQLFRLVLGHTVNGVGRVVTEDVQFVKTCAQAQVGTSLRCAVWAAALVSPLELQCVQVGTLKKFATGFGNAQKPDMARALANAEPTQYRLTDGDQIITADGRRIDHNEVDAIWLARFTMAVDRGEEQFLSRYERKQAAKLERRAKRTAARARKKALREAAKLKVRAKRRMRRTRFKHALLDATNEQPVTITP
jgi:hypothetical protein